jgi:hypothetical protein
VTLQVNNLQSKLLAVFANFFLKHEYVNQKAVIRKLRQEANTLNHVEEVDMVKNQFRSLSRNKTLASQIMGLAAVTSK